MSTIHTIIGSTHVQECIKLQAINERHTIDAYIITGICKI